MPYRSTRLTSGHTRAWDGFVVLDVGVVGFVADVGVVCFVADVGLVGFAVDVGLVGVSKPVVLVPGTCDITILSFTG